MEPGNHTIQLILICPGKKYVVATYKNQYHSLMSLISEYTELQGFGLCSGMGSCGTCLVEITDPAGNFKRTLLSCEIQVNEDLSNVIIKIP